MDIISITINVLQTVLIYQQFPIVLPIIVTVARITVKLVKLEPQIVYPVNQTTIFLIILVLHNVQMEHIMQHKMEY